MFKNTSPLTVLLYIVGAVFLAVSLVGAWRQASVADGQELSREAKRALQDKLAEIARRRQQGILS